MAATYSYGGEFSSDEDIDRMEQQAERIAQSKFDSFAQNKPTKRQIEEAIESVRQMPTDQDINIADDLLAALLDHYRTPRGPIVDSTRALYKKIVLRMVRGDSPNQATNGGDQGKETNGSGIKNTSSNGNTVNNNNNNNVDILKGKAQVYDVHSSDEDEPMPPVTSQTGKTMVKNANDKGVPMEVDAPEKPAYRSKPDFDDDDDEVESSSEKTQSSSVSEEEYEDEEYSSSEDDEDEEEEEENASSVPKTTPRKLTKSLQEPKEKQPEVTPHKKPYTRSQRVAATRASSSIKSSKTDVSSSKVDGAHQTDGTTSVFKSTRSSQGLRSRLQPKIIIPAAAVLVLALLLFFFRTDLTKTTGRLF